MLIHSVYFWLRKDLNTTQRADFVTGLQSLKGIGAASAVYTGTPSATPERPIIDNSYDFCLTVLLPDLAAHDAYQIDPLHKDFLATFAPLWERVQIYDAD